MAPGPVVPQLCPSTALPGAASDSLSLKSSTHCDVRVWKLQENKLALFEAPRRLRRCFTLLLGSSSQCFGVHGSKIRLLQGSLGICFLCLYIFQSLLPPFADFVAVASASSSERMAAVRGAFTCIGKQQKALGAGGSTTLYIKQHMGALPHGHGESSAPRSPQAKADHGSARDTEAHSRDKCPSWSHAARGGQCISYW